MACGANPDGNLARQIRLLRRAVDEGAQIVCTQELFRSQYFCQSEDHGCFGLAETIPGPSTDALCAFAREHEVVVVGSLFERRAAGPLPQHGRGDRRRRLADGHLPQDAHPRRSALLREVLLHAGDLGFRALKTRYATIGVLVCWDQWYPEAARLTALQGAEILFYPTAIGWHPSEKQEYGKTQHESWELIQRSHAIANGCYVCAPNRIGHELVLGPNGQPVNKDGIQFWGQSFVSAPNGQVVKRGSIARPEVLVVDCNLDLVESARTHWPFLRDRRIDAYGALTQRFGD